ncbi:hypothetical protein DEO72_LG6g1449 [Vigna unguiculata]|uniref:Uncharacterized protein n=1 Tax=Vigna unguiculata TaxID=3917 RepID=A0A4D6M7T1_VIGUN|nr:hypothetical protein DEO72_LG6g1449 [Vigna unguiculata]
MARSCDNMILLVLSTKSLRRSGCNFVHVESLEISRKKGQQPNKDKGLMIHHTYSLESLGLESPDLVDAIPRYEMWKAVRTKSDGQMTSQSAQIISQKIDELIK